MQSEIAAMDCPAQLQQVQQGDLVLAPKDNVFNRGQVIATKLPKVKVALLDSGVTQVSTGTQCYVGLL
jgi:hypothetical protein